MQKRIFAGFLSFVYICIHLSRREVRIPLSDLSPSCLSARSKPRSGIPSSYVMFFFVFSKVRWEVIVRFVDICGLVDHHCCFIFLIIIAANVFTCTGYFTSKTHAVSQTVVRVPTTTYCFQIQTQSHVFKCQFAISVWVFFPQCACIPQRGHGWHSSKGHWLLNTSLTPVT